MSSSEKKIAANRQNAQKSTGPRTEVGKSRICSNALTHGLYADPRNLPGEDPQQSLELVKQMRDFYRPLGPEEDALVDDIISIRQELRRTNHAYDVHRTKLIKRQAVSRQKRGKIQELEESLEIKTLTAEDRWLTNRRLQMTYATTKPKVRPKDLDDALDFMISDEREVAVTAHVDRRKRQLMQDLDDRLARLHNLQEARQPKMTVLPPSSDGDQTSMTNQSEAPQRLTLRRSNNDSDKVLTPARILKISSQTRR